MSPQVKISNGSLLGSESKGVLVFKGIPFAEPPIGELRWRPPQPVKSWSGERDATDFGPSSLQRELPGGSGDLIGIPSETTSEDCLYLNVWTPGLEGNRPVLVWIHGGANLVGSGSQPRINGEHLARKGDVVVVTLNYRLGALGFLHAPELGATGNEALLDQISGLRWVRQEIGNFGGNPEDVTVFGQSAGGMDIVQIMGITEGQGCFDKAIPMSGSLAAAVPRDQAEQTTAYFSEHFGGMEKLRDVQAEAILDYQVELSGSSDIDVRFGPVLDGKLIRRDAAVTIKSGEFTKGIPLLIGNTRDEATLFVDPTGPLKDMDNEGLERMAAGIFKDKASQAVEGYRKTRGANNQGTKPVDIWAGMVTDRMFRIPATRTASLHSAHTPQTWMYLFDYPSPALDGKLGSCHSLDIPFIWGTYGVENMKRFCGEGPALPSLSEKMMATYLAFAKTGDPSNVLLPEWPSYNTSSRATMRLGENCRIEEAPMEEVRSLWEKLDS